MGKKVESAAGYEKGSKGGSRHRIENVSESSICDLSGVKKGSGFISFFEFAVYISRLLSAQAMSPFCTR